MNLRLVGTALLIAFVTAGCAEQPFGPTGDNAPLTQAIAEASGRAFIGFKEAGQARGVDEKGLVLTNDETVAAMKSFLVAAGISIVWQFDLIPAVVVELEADADIISELLAHPNIDYIEPIELGEWTG